MSLLMIILVIALLASLPTWPHSRGWGYYPSTGVGIVLAILLLMMFTGRL